MNHYFEYGFMGFLDPEVSPETMVQNINVFYASCEQETIGIESVAKVSLILSKNIEKLPGNEQMVGEELLSKQ